MLLPKAALGEQARVPALLAAAENIGRITVLVLPFFFSLDPHKRFSALVIAVMGLALLIYYACWLRYFLGGRLAEFLGAPFLWTDSRQVAPSGRPDGHR